MEDAVQFLCSYFLLVSHDKKVNTWAGNVTQSWSVYLACERPLVQFPASENKQTNKQDICALRSDLITGVKFIPYFLFERLIKLFIKAGGPG